MKEPQYKPITGMINVNDIQEIIENNRFYQEEIERLNNIINELEQWLYDNTNYEEYDRVEKDAFNYVIKKIEELKGSDKEC